MALGYRKKQSSDTWHFCCNCSQWPRLDFIELWQLPSIGEMRNECEVRRREGELSLNVVRQHSLEFKGCLVTREV
jgi:hypothetical protein